MKKLLLFAALLCQFTANAQQKSDSIKTALLIVDIQNFYFPGDGKPGLVNAEQASLVAKDILQASGDRIYKAEFVSCPTCGRTSYDLESVLSKVKERCSHLVGVRIGVMGCIVNGPGEMADADYGYVGSGNKKVNLYRGKDLAFQNIDEEAAIEKLIDMIKEDGRWIER